MSSRERLSSLVVVLSLTIATGCASPERVKLVSQAQIEGLQEVESQLRGLHRQIVDLLRTYADLTVEGHQRERMLDVIGELAGEDPPRPLNEADLLIARTRDEAAREMAESAAALEANLAVLRQSRDAALTEIGNLIILHSIINDYLQVDLTVSKEDVEEISVAIRELREDSGGGR